MDGPALPELPDGTLVLKDSEYAFGTGVLRLRVTRVRGQLVHDGVDLVHVEGMGYAWDGSETGIRSAYIRPDRVPRQFRHGGPRGG